MFTALRRFLSDSIFWDKDVIAPLHPLSLRLSELQQLLARSASKTHPNYKRIELDVNELQKKLTALLDGSHARDIRRLKLKARYKVVDSTNELLERGINPNADRELRRWIMTKSSKVLLNSWNIEYDEDFLSRAIDALEREVNQFVWRINRNNKTVWETDLPSVWIYGNISYQQSDGAVDIYNKLSRIRARIQTLSSRNLEDSQDELCKLFRDVLHAEIPSDSEANILREAIFLEISTIFEWQNSKRNEMRIGDNGDSIQLSIWNWPMQNSSQKELNIPIWNQEFLEYISYISWLLTYKESSKKNWESVGDGNFIKNVWNPFLSYLEACWKSNHVDFNNFSWKGLIDKIYTENEWIRGQKRRANFLDILSHYEAIWDWKTNWQYVIQAIGEHASIDGFYKSGKWVKPLANVLSKLKDNPPPSR